MCLAQGHNAVTPVRLEPAALRSRVKHSTTEPLRSLSWHMPQQNSISSAAAILRHSSLKMFSYNPLLHRLLRSCHSLLLLANIEKNQEKDKLSLEYF